MYEDLAKEILEMLKLKVGEDVNEYAIPHIAMLIDGRVTSRLLELRVSNANGGQFPDNNKWEISDDYIFQEIDGEVWSIELRTPHDATMTMGKTLANKIFKNINDSRLSC